MQAQRVSMNFVRNAVDAMRDLKDRRRRIPITTEADSESTIRLTARESAGGFDPQDAEPPFDAFYMIKADGMGAALAVSR
ncbi:hypothetical protein BTH42_04220 [Burkholderia sp. SRS-W-2-2016]|nr:hypothetical protein BTH42_04220 [Burkholderia sp. SRS-W-2-2016]